MTTRTPRKEHRIELLVDGRVAIDGIVRRTTGNHGSRALRVQPSTVRRGLVEVGDQIVHARRPGQRDRADESCSADVFDSLLVDPLSFDECWIDGRLEYMAPVGPRRRPA
jgi:hypothetical protein